MTLPLTDIQDFLVLRKKVFEHSPHQEQSLALLNNYKDTFLATFESLPNPPKKWISDLIVLAFEERDRDSFLHILNVYLNAIERTPILNSDTLKGLADLIGLASRFDDLLRPEHITQLFGALQGKSLLYQTNLSPESFKNTADLWERLLIALQANQIDLSGEKKVIKKIIKAMEQSFENANDNEGLHQCRLLKQAWLRLDNRANERSPWVKAGLCLGSGGLHLVAAVGVAAAGGSATYGVGALAGAPDLLHAIGDVGKAGIIMVKALKAKLDKEGWYYTVRDLKAILTASAFSHNQDDQGHYGVDFVNIIAEMLVGLETSLTLLYSLTPTLIDICTALPNKSHQMIHQAIYQILLQWFESNDEPELRSYIMAAFTTVGTNTKIQDFLDLRVFTASSCDLISS